MKKNERINKILLITIVIVILLSSCTIGSGTPGFFSRLIWADAGESTSNLDFDGNYNLESRSSRSLAGGGIDVNNKVYFRSSSIDFWSFNSLIEIEDSLKLEYQMGDQMESIVFFPDSVIANDLSNDFNPGWNEDVASFLSNETYTGAINMARMDIGAGSIDFIIDGVNRAVQIDTNCVLFIDEQYMSETFLLTRDLRNKLLSGEIASADLGLSDSECNFVDMIISLGASSDNYQLDIDGALIIPFTPYTIDNYDPDVNSLVIEIKWDMNSAIYEEFGFYYMTERVSGTCFDFEVAIKVE